MNELFSQVALTNVHADIIRNIVSIHESQDLFDDLTDNPHEWALAQRVENEIKPVHYRSSTPIVHRPFEDAHWCNAIEWPFKHWQQSRFSNGSFGVWYGCDTLETSVYETAYHWLHGFLADAGFDRLAVSVERKIYRVNCQASLLDFRPLVSRYPALVHKTDYGATQAIGAKMHREGHPGLVTRSARHPQGQNHAILNPAVLSQPNHHCQLKYLLEKDRIVIEKQHQTTWLEIPRHLLENNPALA